MIAPLNAAELAAVCDELRRTVLGHPVQRIVQWDETTVVLDLRGRGLLVSVHPRLGRLHLLSGKPSGTGEQPPAFCMLLRKYLEGARLVRVQPVAGERAVELGFARSDGERALRLFLFGRAAQLQLVEEGQLLGHLGPAQRIYDGLPAPRQLVEPLALRFEPGEAPSAVLEALFAEAAAIARSEEQRQQALARLHAEAKRLARLRGALVNDLDRMEKVPLLRKEADLLLALAADQGPGQAEIRLPDLIDAADGDVELTIALDPALSAVDNAQRRYKQCRRLERGQRALRTRLETVEAELARVEGRLAAVEQGEPADRGDGTRTVRPSAPPTSRAAARDARRPPYRAYRSARGVPILVGRGADRNDELTFKVARGNDWWLHTRDAPGSHVIVTLDGRPLDEATLLDAATLAAHFSTLRDEAQVDVSYVQRKAVRKPPKSRPGMVTHSGSKTIRVRLEPERLQRLLATLEEP